MARRLDYYLERLVGEEQQTFHQAIHDFVDDAIAPRWLEWERGHQLIPDDAIAQMAEMGLFGVTVSEEYGGQGGSQLDLLLMGLALGYQSQSLAITPGAALSLGAKPLQLCGTEVQKAAHLPDLAAGKRMFVFGLSEPGRGTDATNPQVTATRDGDGWVIRGEKCWSTNARWASHVIVHALTDPDGKPGHRSSCFIVPMESEDVHYQEMAGKDLWEQSSTGSIMLDSVRVSEDDLLGDHNEGFRVMVTSLNGGRLFIAALSLASLACALDRVREYAQEREIMGGPLGRYQRVQDVVLDMDIALEQGLTWLIDLCNRYDAGTLDRESAAKVKVECSRRASNLLTLAMEVCGGVACFDEFGLSRHHRDLFVCRVGEGSNFALKGFATRPLMPSITLD
ncbi:MAG: acyl-CoA dehydrogenase family protein [Candidatus Poseidoniia archaeon]|nr:acyl-CoA dehydrogenase family protein [Candidatus Poseidoniia archaeon]MDP7474299.1 acyl-CoA dehydrogenase family protein [Candidatus Poseidoniia archaeon]HJO27944.1 acyl-CoA dehydrogenase family protein [Candidatus Poseidoniia archaeon]